MEFKVTRTSMHYEEKPCKEAVKKHYTRVETRMFKNFEEFDRRFSNLEGKWLSKGINHCVKKGYIQREFPDECEGCMARKFYNWLQEKIMKGEY